MQATDVKLSALAKCLTMLSTYPLNSRRRPPGASASFTHDSLWYGNTSMATVRVGAELNLRASARNY